jgi:hypothetical protein
MTACLPPIHILAPTDMRSRHVSHRHCRRHTRALRCHERSSSRAGWNGWHSRRMHRYGRRLLIAVEWDNIRYLALAVPPDRYEVVDGHELR